MYFLVGNYFWGRYYKTFSRPQFIPYRNRLDCLYLSFTSTLVCYLLARIEPTRVDSFNGLHHGQTLANRTKPGPCFQL
jgi:hypothetical protein